MLGGSTTWGTGAPDGQTIPSYLAKLLNSWGVDTQVRNLGESAFVSTQEVVYLMRELQSGRRPDIVIFYDGANDAAAAEFWPENPGTHHNLTGIRNRVERNENAVVHLLRSTALNRAAQFILRRIGPNGTKSGNLVNTTDIPRLGERAANIWLGNYNMTEALGQAYGFVPVFIFQPSLTVGEKPLDASEEGFAATKSGKGVRKEMRKAVRQHLQEEGAPAGIYDLSDVFAGVADPIYIDSVHITGKGNQLVAERLFEIVTNDLCQQVPAHVIAHVSVLTRTQLTLACTGGLSAKVDPS